MRTGKNESFLMIRFDMPESAGQLRTRAGRTPAKSVNSAASFTENCSIFSETA